MDQSAIGALSAQQNSFATAASFATRASGSRTLENADELRMVYR
jgi:hypothetical protein